MKVKPGSESRVVEDLTDKQDCRSVLVVGVDGSPPSWDAFAWAAGEARRCGGRMIAVFATPLVDPMAAVGVTAPMANGALEDAKAQIAAELAAEVGRRAGELGVDVRFIREYGDVARVLTRVACATHADLVAVGRSAGTLHQVAGSLSRRLVLSRELPVVVVVP
jgi:nucleotide-binding universal stress UspA family protein